jgi:chorismate mutase
MSIQVKFRRGTATQHLSFTGANGEITVDTTNHTLRVHDGVTVGGFRIAKFSEAGGNTSSYLQVSNANAKFATKAYAAANSYVKSVLANTNSYIASKVSTSTFNSALANTNAYIAGKVDYADLTAAYSAINSKVSTATFNSALANTNAYIAAVSTAGGALGNTNLYIKSVSDREYLHLANTNAFITTVSNRERSALANTNNYIATKTNSSTFNSALANTNAFIKTQLANTNAYIASKLSVSGSNIILANTNAYIATKVSITTFNNAIANSRAALANTNAYIATKLNTTTFYSVFNNAIANTRTALANTNAYIATKVSTSTFNSALANTNAFIKTRASWTGLTGTNTALRSLISDRMQVANVNTNFLSKTSTNPQTVAGRVNFTSNVNISGTLFLSGNATYINTISFNTTDALIRLAGNNDISDVVDIGFYGNYKSISGNDHTGLFRRATTKQYYLFGNYTKEEPGTTIDINHSSFKYADLNMGKLYSTKIIVNGTDIESRYAQNTYVKSVLANTNSYIATKASWTGLTGTNTALRSLINNRLQVANAVATYQTIAVERAALANTNAYIASVVSSGGATWSALLATNTNLRTLISDRLQVANAAATYQTKAVERAALANTNAYIGNQATRITLVNTNLVNTNTAIRTLVNARLQVANAVATYQTKAVERAALANTNSYIATKVSTSTFNSALANTNAYINTVVSAGGATWTGLTQTNTALRLLISDRLQVGNAAFTYQTIANERAALANTNAYIASKPSWSAITGTNTALRTLINDRLQVANAVATYQTKSVERAALANTNAFIKSQLANTNSYIATRASWSALTGTNTALRTLISDRLQVANAHTYVLYANVKSQLANTNSYIATKASWSALTGTNTAIRALDSQKLQVANAIATYATKLNPVTSGLIQHTGRMTISTNLDVSGNTQIYKLLANGSLGTAGYALKTNGTSVYWDAVGSGSASSSNGFSGILVGSNTIIATTPTSRVSLVAGSGMTISANPSTKAITFASTASGGGSLVTTTTKTLDSLLGTDTVITSVTGTVATGYLQVANASAYYATKTSVQGPAFSAYADSSTQTIPTDTQTKVLFQTEEFDTNSNFASSRFTPTVAGYYQLNAEVRMNGNSGTGELMITIWKNGSEYKRGWNSKGVEIGSSGQFWAMSVNSLVYANGTGDYFEIKVQHGAGADRTVTAVSSPAITWFNGAMVRGV